MPYANSMHIFTRNSVAKGIEKWIFKFQQTLIYTDRQFCLKYLTKPIGSCYKLNMCCLCNFLPLRYVPFQLFSKVYGTDQIGLVSVEFSVSTLDEVIPLKKNMTGIIIKFYNMPGISGSHCVQRIGRHQAK